jgi:ADP-ribose pyrophosphatase YjhB (NUDIX family)
MISKAANCLHRIAFRLAYPILSRLERALGICSNVVAVAVWHGDKLLLIRHSYKPGDALPGGTLRVGEPPVDAAARELYEEVGISASPDELIPLRSWKQREGGRWLFEYRPPSMPRIVPDQREVVAAQFVARHEIPNSISVILGNNSER